MDDLDSLDELGEKIRLKKELLWETTKNPAMAFKSEALQAIFLITDTDACFLKSKDFLDTPSSLTKTKRFFYDTEAKKILYDGSQATFNSNSRDKQLVDRNNHRSYLLKDASKIEKVIYDGVEVNFAAFYMSCNIDHVMFDNANLTDKTNMANMRREEYITGNRSFIVDISQCGFKDAFSSFRNNLIKSWQFVSKKTHSIERNTNLNLLIDAIKANTLPFGIS